MAHSKIIPKHPSGDSLLMAIILLAAIGVLLAVIFEFSGTSQRITSKRANDQVAIQLGEAGIEKAVWCLNNPSQPTTICPGNPNYTGETNVAIGGGTFSVSVGGTGNTRIVTATGTKSGAGGTSSRDVTVRLTTSGTLVSFQYGLQAGTGGITMDNNARVIGNVYSNGSIIGLNNTEVTGDAVLAVGNATVNAAANPNPFTLSNFGTDGNTNDYLVQSFVPTTSERVYQVDLKLARRNSSTTSTVDIEIRNNSGGSPGSTVLGSISNLAASTFPVATASGWENGWTEMNLTTANALTASTTYWIVIHVDTPHATNYFHTVRSQDDDAVYPNGTARLGRDLSTLSALCGVACDLAFQVRMGGTFPRLQVLGGGVGGSAFANTIEGTPIVGHACYQTLIGTVTAGGGSETCSTTSTGPVPCTTENTEPADTPKCHPGNDDPPPAPFPLTTAQIAQMEAQAEAGGVTTCSPTCTITHGSLIGPRKYVGDVTFDGNAQVTLTGTVWVTGTLRLINNNRITLAEGYGADGGVIVAHDPADETTKGKISLDNNVEIFRNSNTTSNVLMIAMNNSDDNADPAFKADNNVNKRDNVNDDLERLIMYAHNGVVFLGNNVGPDAVTAKRLHLSNNVEVTYNSGFASAYFTSGPGGSWTYQRGTYQILN